MDGSTSVLNGISKSYKYKIFQFKITLLESDPEIWRRVLVPSNITFFRFHNIIQDAMGWDNNKIWCFLVDDLHIGIHDLYPPDHVVHAKFAKINTTKYFCQSGDKALYGYLKKGPSFEWIHQVDLENTLPVDLTKYPQCIAGQGACPPENCGGMQRYKTLLERLADQNHPKHYGAKEWMIRNQRIFFDPKEFDPDTVTFTQIYTPGKPWMRNKPQDDDYCKQ